MKTENISKIIADELKIKVFQVDAVTELLDEGNTIPFISRYRKEKTGELDEEKVRIISERLTYLRNFVKRQEEIINKIEEQGKLTPELQLAIEKTTKLQELEDIYLPYKQKKRTRAQKAKEKGLEPLASTIILQNLAMGTPEEVAAEYINPELEVETAQDALAGAQDIIAEMISEDAQLRQELRKFLWNNAFITTTLDEDKENTDEGKVFLMYKDYKELVRTLPSHRILAINRGEKLECLKV
ncbi:MAG TPA: RNA-binding transcriptional accessory protein, partial [Anaerovibrio sp.]|nr:RNA-binding transcriptional accessory protein [Anaerovibrio sp.]